MTSGARTRTSVSLSHVFVVSGFSRTVIRSDATVRLKADTTDDAIRAPRDLPAVAQHLHGLAARFLAASRHPGHPAELLQHLLHLHELLQQTIHFFDRRPAAAGDPLAAAAVNDVLLPPLFGRHRTDDRLDARNLLLIRFLIG